MNASFDLTSVKDSTKEMNHSVSSLKRKNISDYVDNSIKIQEGDIVYWRDPDGPVVGKVKSVRMKTALVIEMNEAFTDNTDRYKKSRNRNWKTKDGKIVSDTMKARTVKLCKLKRLDEACQLLLDDTDDIN